MPFAPVDSVRAFVETVTLGGGYNTNVVLVGATLLGIAGGVVGTFTMLDKKALVVDAFSHASLAGVAGAFLVHSALVGAGFERVLAVLLAGAAVAGLAAMASITLLTSRTRLSADTATAAVSSASFGLGVVLLSIARQGTGAD